MKITIERGGCIGCGSCAMLCSQCFKMESDGKSDLVGGERTAEGNAELEIQELSCVQESVDACPVQVIHVV